LGDETIQFASRFSVAVDLLAGLAGDEDAAAARRRLGTGLEAAVAEALDAVAALHETGTDAVKDWASRREQVLARVAAARLALTRGGVDAALRREAGALVALLGAPGAEAATSPGWTASSRRR
jgi:hypothetical protein